MLCHNNADADDIVQETFISFFLDSKKKQNNYKYILSKLKVITKNKTIDLIRKHKRTTANNISLSQNQFLEESITDTTQCPYHHIFQKELEEKLTLFLNCLDPITKEVFYLIKLESHNIEEVSSKLNIGKNIVKKILNQCDSKLKRIYKRFTPSFY